MKRARSSNTRLVAALTGVLLFLAISCANHSTDIATYKVAPAQFTRRVTADGTLKAVEATPITAPHDVQQALKIAWIAEDGAVLKKDDTVIRFDPTEFKNELLGGTEDPRVEAQRG